MQIDQVIDYFLNNMEIVFYSHRVNYPMCLSAQTIHPDLKLKVIDKLEKMYSTITNYNIVKKYPILEAITKSQIKDNINFLKAKDLHHLWPDTVKFNLNLDKSRNQNFYDINPEFKNYV